MSEAAQMILPDGFKRVEYLQSTGTQWIDTGIIPNNETGLYLKASRLNGGDLVPAGARTNNIRFYPPRLDMNSGTIQYGWENYYVLGNRNSSDNLSYESWLNFYNTRKASIQTQSNFHETTLNATLPSLSHTIYVFDWNYNGSAGTHWIGKIYEVKISQGENIVKHFIPCLDNDDIPCMYDLVNDEAYYNQGTGQFYYPRNYPSSNYNLPAGYKKCVYLQSDGTQWIDTGVIPDNETGLYFKALQLSYGNFVPFGVHQIVNNVEFIIYPPRFTNKNLYYRWGTTGTYMMAWDKADDLIFHSSLNLYNSKIAKFDSEDTDTESYMSSQNGAFAYPIWLFSVNSSGSYIGTIGKWGGRIFRAQITQGVDLIHDYVPCLDADNRPCMYDLIEQEALYNQSGGTEFTYCVEHQLPSDFAKLKYLEDTGTQYINIGIIPTNETGLYVDAQQITHTNSQVIGSGVDTNGTGFGVPRFLKGTANSCGFMWKNWISYGNIGNGTRFESCLNLYNDRKANLKTAGTTERINNLGELGFTPTVPLYMFRTNYASHGNWNGRVYRAKITQGTELVRDFVPAWDERKTRPCMYDLINNIAYYNDGTGEFLYNRDYEGTYKGFTGLGCIGNRLSGNTYTLVNALITDGNCRIDLGKGIINSDISHDFRGYTTNASKFMFGTSNTGADYFWQGNGMLVWGGWICNVASNSDVIVVVDDKNNKVRYNDTIITKNANFVSDKQTSIFDVGRKDTEKKFMPAANGSKFYKWVMKKDGVIIHDYRPAVDNNSIPCVLDTITGEAFYNSLSGVLTWE